MKNLSKISLFLGLLAFVSLISCNQTKESVFKQKYHDLTAHYNAYFNAKEAFNIAYKNLLKNSAEDYSEILPLYAYGTPTDAKSYSADFQRTIDKATIAIAEHEISKWSDNSFLLIGKSFYLQGDYNKAIETFQYITSEYQQGYKNEIMGKSSKSKSKKKKKKKRKKKKGKKKSSSSNDEVEEAEYGLLEHIPSKYEALIWLSKAYVQQDKFKEAESILTFASTSPDFPSNMVIELNTAKAFVKLEKNDYSGSLASLQNLIAASSKKKDKARYNFIIGQVYSEIGNYSDAQIAFERCLNNQPNYKMAFYAKLNNARLARLNGRSTEEIRAQLNKMSKDGKNEEFLDQIYYELAEIAVENDNFESATEYLKKSVRASVNNDEQKGKSFLRLGELHYDVEIYTKSKLYYDSAVALLPTDWENYDLVSERKEILTNLVQQLDIIATQDSLQKLATLSENELRKIINKKISDKMASEAAQEEIAASELGGPERLNDATSALAFNSGKGSWYFYNSSALSKGYNAFQSKWGKRKLEDDWRRKDKSSFESEEEEIVEDFGDDELEIDQSEYERYLTTIPTDKKNIEASNDKVISALYTSAIIYKDDLENFKKAIEQFEELLKRYPGNEFKLESYYNLYLIHEGLGNGGKQETYKNKILAEFPGSKIAKIISDPTYASAIQSEDDEVNDYYKKTYALYQQGSYDEVIERNIQSRSQFRNNDLEPKFEFLAAMSIGQKGQMPKFEEALINIINKYPEDEVKSKAQEILMVLGGENLPDPVKEVKVEEPVVVDDNDATFEEPTEEVAMLDENLSEEEKMRKVFQDAIKNSKQENGGGFFGNVDTDGENSQDGFGGWGDLNESEEDGEDGLFSFGGKETKEKEPAKPKTKEKSKSQTKTDPSKDDSSANNTGNNNSGNQNNTGNTANNTSNNSSGNQNNSSNPANNTSGNQNNSSNPANNTSGNQNNSSSTANNTSGNQNNSSSTANNTSGNQNNSSNPANNTSGNQNNSSSTANNTSGNQNNSSSTANNTSGNQNNSSNPANNTSGNQNNSTGNQAGPGDNPSATNSSTDTSQANSEPQISDNTSEETENSIDNTSSDDSSEVSETEEVKEAEIPLADDGNTEKAEEGEEAIAMNTEAENPIEEAVAEPAEEVSSEEEESFFGISNNAPHYYVLHVPVAQDVESFKKEVDRFNSANYNSLILRTTTMNLAGKKMLIAKKFKSANAANSYRLALEKDPAFSGLLKDVEHDSYSISVLNYAILLGNKDFSKYLEFHSENY